MDKGMPRKRREHIAWCMERAGRRKGRKRSRTAQPLQNQRGKGFKDAACNSVTERMEMLTVNEGCWTCPRKTFIPCEEPGF